MNPELISITDYTYDLPEERIAMHPLMDRDHSKLLVYQSGKLTDAQFYNLSEYIPAGSQLVFNNTRVINARIKFVKSTGASIEIFLLEPWGEVTEYNSVMSAHRTSTWKCMVGGAAKWKNETLEKRISVGDKPVLLKAIMKEKITGAFLIGFSWEDENITFAEVLESAGEIPLPPYIKRESEKGDLDRYQTIFALEKGSVAAPTAGLHFTDKVFTDLKNKKVKDVYLTLHVGAGTFRPVKADQMKDHEMHAEYIDVSGQTIEELLSNSRLCLAVGTTALRTLETLYWLGVKVLLEPGLQSMKLGQWELYQQPLKHTYYSKTEALAALLKWMERNHTKRIFTHTQLMIVPGYRFRMANALITNFHQPQSTLLLLVAAAMGPEWKNLYMHALNNDYRFLSYGDANLIFIEES